MARPWAPPEDLPLVCRPRPAAPQQVSSGCRCPASLHLPALSCKATASHGQAKNNQAAELRLGTRCRGQRPPHHHISSQGGVGVLQTKAIV